MINIKGFCLVLQSNIQLSHISPSPVSYEVSIVSIFDFTEIVLYQDTTLLFFHQACLGFLSVSMDRFDRLMQERHNSIANTLELVFLALTHLYIDTKITDLAVPGTQFQLLKNSSPSRLEFLKAIWWNNQVQF